MKAKNIFYGFENPKNKTVYHQTSDYIFSKYKLRYNEISHDYELRLLNNTKWRILNLQSLLIELESEGIKISIAKLEIFIKSDFIESYNPMRDYFENLPEWDKVDWIKKYAEFVPVEFADQFQYHFKKFLVRAVRCALEPNYVNKQCFVLVHPGQNSGKTSWCRDICPPGLKAYYTEEIGRGKDANIQLTRNFLIVFDDFDGENKKDLSSRKAMMSKMRINERLPYDRKNSKLPRICSFLGSTNEFTFLKDETGSVRWLCFELKGKIDFTYKSEIDINSIWAQAYYLAYKDKSFEPTLTLEDIRLNEIRNSKYRELSQEEEILTKYYYPGKEMTDFLTATEITNDLNSLNLSLSKINMGRALSAQNFPRVKHPKRQLYGYLAKPLFKVSPWELENK